MPYYRRKYIKTVGKQKYQQAIRSLTCSVQLPYTNEVLAGGLEWANWGRVNSAVILENKPDENRYVPPMMKFRHLRVTFSFPSLNQGGRICAVKCYIIFIPQGIDATFSLDTEVRQQPQQGGQQQLVRTCKHEIAGTIKDHPEWVLCQKSTRINTTETTQVTLRPQFSRNLHSGDQIIAATVWLFEQNDVNQRQLYKYNVDWSYCARVN